MTISSLGSEEEMEAVVVAGVEGEESLLRRLRVQVQVRWWKEAEMTERERHREEMGGQRHWELGGTTTRGRE